MQSDSAGGARVANPRSVCTNRRVTDSSGRTKNLRRWFDDDQARRRARKALFVSIGLTIGLYLIPFGFWVAYPLTLFSTLVHELGHGLAALATGGRFSELSVFANTSGVAHTSSGAGDVGRAITSAGGLVGPAVLAGIGFAVCTRERGSRIFLAVLAIGLALVTALFIRNAFGIVFTVLVVAGLGWTVIRTTVGTQQLVALFLAVQLALSVFSRGDYLFTDTAHTGAGVLSSDVANMAKALGGTYWMWGLACGAFSILVLWLGVWLFLRRITPKPVTTL